MDGSKEFTNNNEKYEYFLEDHNHCCLCGSKLVFNHQIDFLTLKVQEDADCTSCGIRLKTKEHGLQ